MLQPAVLLRQHHFQGEKSFPTGQRLKFYRLLKLPGGDVATSSLLTPVASPVGIPPS